MQILVSSEKCKDHTKYPHLEKQNEEEGSCTLLRLFEGIKIFYSNSNSTCNGIKEVILANR